MKIIPYILGFVPVIGTALADAENRGFFADLDKIAAAQNFSNLIVIIGIIVFVYLLYIWTKKK